MINEANICLTCLKEKYNKVFIPRKDEMIDRFCEYCGRNGNVVKFLVLNGFKESKQKG